MLYFNKTVNQSWAAIYILFEGGVGGSAGDPYKDGFIESFDSTKKDFNLLSNLIEAKAPRCLS